MPYGDERLNGHADLQLDSRLLCYSRMQLSECPKVSKVVEHKWCRGSHADVEGFLQLDPIDLILGVCISWHINWCACESVLSLQNDLSLSVAERDVLWVMHVSVWEGTLKLCRSEAVNAWYRLYL